VTAAAEREPGAVVTRQLEGDREAVPRRAKRARTGAGAGSGCARLLGSLRG
jgi:hypothetical protein